MDGLVWVRGEAVAFMVDLSRSQDAMAEELAGQIRSTIAVLRPLIDPAISDETWYGVITEDLAKEIGRLILMATAEDDEEDLAYIPTEWRRRWGGDPPAWLS